MAVDRRFVGQTLAYGMVAAVFVLYQTEAPPDAGEWETWLRTMLAFGEELATTPCLVMTDGGGPDLLHRRSAEQMMRTAGVQGILTAVVSGAPHVPEIVRVVSWFNPLIRFFATGQTTEALAYLGVLPDRHTEVLALVDDLRLAVQQVNDVLSRDPS